ncbi:MAG: site-specific DNA-methyltransferase [Acidobacteria bacterium]|nr:site-specific DNA-methyltransferase [Acidobacteriota bacterium]
MSERLPHTNSLSETKEGFPAASGGALVSRQLRNLQNLTCEAERRWKDKLVLEPALSRSLVSFQANKSRAVYRWFKYKEAFSAGLVEYLLHRYRITKGKLLDPFAGSGTALFAGGAFGMRPEGIELLPIGQTVIATKQIIDWEIQPQDVERLVFWLQAQPWKKHAAVKPINELQITRGAYPQETVVAMGRFLGAVEQENQHVKTVLFFAYLCILESISYTRKDGQYLRWDHRSGRRPGNKIFDKGKILPFDRAITSKLQEIITDLRSTDLPEDLFGTVRSRTEIVLRSGSCLDILPKLKAGTFDCLVTSPPYCNRYDYTRTYALELAAIGVDESGLAKLRQEMLSCTVENRAKNLLALNPKWNGAIAVVNQHELLQAILAYLESQKELGLLNNTGISRMVRGYFYEMACVIAECARVLKSNALLMMVNDNVRYAGAIVPVDIILTELAEHLGFVAEQILVLPNGKGNSSQQMGAYGRESLRKCVYIWRKV